MRLTLSPLVDRLSGRIGNLCFSVNKRRPYARLWTHPTDPATPAQQAQRDIYSRCRLLLDSLPYHATLALKNNISPPYYSPWQYHASKNLPLEPDARSHFVIPPSTSIPQPTGLWWEDTGIFMALNWDIPGLGAGFQVRCWSRYRAPGARQDYWTLRSEHSVNADAGKLQCAWASPVSQYIVALSFEKTADDSLSENAYVDTHP